MPTSFLAVALMIGTIQIYVPRRFADYVDWAALDRLDGVMAELSKEYQIRHGWEALREDPAHWHEILGMNQQMTPSLAPSTSRPLPPLSAEAPGEAAAYAAVSPASSRQDSPQPISSGHQGQWTRNLALFDADKRLVIGEPAEAQPDNFNCRPIRLDDRIIGWLGLHKRDHLSDPLVVSFLNEQLTVLYAIGGSILLVVALLSFLLSNHLLAPIRQIRQLAGQLAEGARALASFRARTQDELGRLASNFNQMNDTAERSETLRREWMANISHELRTPLAILRGEIEALRDGVREPSAARLASLHAEVVRLGKLFDDLHMLFLAEAQSLAVRMAPVEPIQTLREMAARYEPRFMRKALDLKLDNQLTRRVLLAGDADRLAQIFSNLLENTLRYTDSPGTLRITATATEQHLSIAFEDSAPGVPAKALRKLFERFYRADPPGSRKSGGSGLGLTICREIVGAHGGTIQADDSPLGGLKITINLPLAVHGKPFSTGE